MSSQPEDALQRFQKVAGDIGSLLVEVDAFKVEKVFELALGCIKTLRSQVGLLLGGAAVKEKDVTNLCEQLEMNAACLEESDEDRAKILDLAHSFPMIVAARSLSMAILNRN